MTRKHDAHSLALFRACPEKYRLRQRLGYRKRSPEAEDAEITPPSVGSVVHACLVPWFGGEGSEVAIARFDELWEAELIEPPKAKYQRSHIRELLQAYMERWPREADDFEVIHNERYVEWQLSDEHTMCGIIDRTVRKDGLLYVMDTKTTSRYISDGTGHDSRSGFWEGYIISPQMLGYCDCVEQQEGECGGYIIDAIHIDTRWHKIDPEKHFKRKVYPVTNPLNNAWAASTKFTIETINWLDHDDEFCRAQWPLNPSNCVSYGRTCEYQDVCVLSEAGRKVALANHYEKGPVWDPKEAAHE